MFLAPLLSLLVSNELFLRLDLTFRHRKLFAFAAVVVIVKELFNASTKQECVVKSFFREKLSALGPCAFIIHVENYELFRLVFEVENFRDHLVATNVWCRVVH